MGMGFLKKMGRKLGLSKGGVTPEAAGHANETTAAQRVAFQPALTQRGLGERIRDKADRFAYWAGGGGQKMNNKTRNWLAEGKEGSWRRNKAERLADKEYAEGLQMIEDNISSQRRSALDRALAEGNLSQDVHQAVNGSMALEQANNVQGFADKLRDQGVGGNHQEYIQEMVNIVQGILSQGTDNYNDYDTFLSEGNGSIREGLFRQKATDAFYANQGDDIWKLSADERKQRKESAVQQIMRENYGIKPDKTAVNDNYRMMLRSRNRQAKDTYLQSVEGKYEDAIARDRILRQRTGIGE